MCKVSNKIKFCTCEKEFPLHLSHYWQLKRRVKDIHVIGEAHTHVNSLDHDLLVINENTILNRLNEKDCFDFAYIPEIDDKLNISFLIDKASNVRMEFNFVYTENGWMPTDFLQWMEDELLGKHPYSAVKSGKLKNTFE